MDNLNEIKETLKDLFKATIKNAKDGDEKGEWVTIKGTHVFIPDGKTVDEVIKEKGWKEKGDSNNKEYKTGDKITFDTNWRGVNPKIGKGEIVGLEPKLGSHGDANPGYQYKVKLEDGKTILVEKEAIQEVKEKSDKPKDKGSEGKKDSSDSKIKKEYNDAVKRIEKLIPKYELEPYVEEELKDDLRSFKKSINNPNLSQQKQVELYDTLLEFEKDIKHNQEMKINFLSDDGLAEKKGKLSRQLMVAKRTGQKTEEAKLQKKYDEIIKEQDRRLNKGSDKPKKRDKDFEALRKELESYKRKNGGDLDLAGMDISHIPDELIPNGLTVTGNLYLEGSKITELPENMRVHGEIIMPDGKTAPSYKEANDLLKKNKSNKKIKNGLSEIIKNCEPETKQDLEILKGLKDILSDEDK